LITDFGWRTALLIIALSIGTVIVLLALFVVRDRPSAELMASSDEFDITGVDVAEVEPSWTFVKLLGSRAFWLVTLAVGLLLASDQAVLTTQVPFFVDIGLTTTQAASIVTAMTGSAIAGKLLVGFLAERYDIRWLYILVALVHAGLLGVFLIQPGYWPTLAVASLFGAAVGGIYPVWSVLISQQFGAASFGTAFGAAALFMQPLAIGLVAYINRSYDSIGSYDTAYSWFLGVIALGTVAIFFIPRKDQN
jgi:Na+/melibiose symporter-like transporter